MKFWAILIITIKLNHLKGQPVENNLIFFVILKFMSEQIDTLYMSYMNFKSLSF